MHYFTIHTYLVLLMLFACKNTPTTNLGASNRSTNPNTAGNPADREFEQQTANGTPTNETPILDPASPVQIDPTTPSALRACFRTTPLGSGHVFSAVDSSVFSSCDKVVDLKPSGQGTYNTIAGRAWFDDNMNGSEDPGELPATNLLFYFDQNGNCIKDANEVAFESGRTVTTAGTRASADPAFFSVIYIPNGPSKIRILGPRYAAYGLIAQYYFHSLDGSNGFGANFNQGTHYQNLSFPIIRPRDFGDAPISYGSADTYHELDKRFFLGDKIDFEKGSAGSLNADLDDRVSCNDDDGVVFPKSMKFDSIVSIDVKASYFGGILNAWIDFDANGKFDAHERVIDYKKLQPGTNRLQVRFPTQKSGTGPVQTYARFRLSPLSIVNANGDATFDIQPTGKALQGGEVEDYRITIE